MVNSERYDIIKIEWFTPIYKCQEYTILSSSKTAIHQNGKNTLWNSLGSFGTFNVLIAVITIAPLDFFKFYSVFRSLSCKDIYSIVCDVL